MIDDTLVFRNADTQDIEDIVRIERKSFSDGWSQAAFETCFSNPFCIFVVGEIEKDDSKSQIVSYGVLMHMYEQGEIVKVAVSNDYLRRGIGQRMVKWLLAIAKHEEVENIFLDVRESNEAARSLYEKMGFVTYESTPDFYNNPTETSIKMRYNILDK